MYAKVLGALCALGLLSWLLLSWSQDTPLNAQQRFAEIKSTTKQAASVSLPQSQIAQLVRQPLPPAQREALEHLPRSLQGVPLPRALEVDDNGELQMNESVRNWFDFYLTAVGEQSLEAMVARMKYQLSRQLPEPALSQALSVMQSYLTYRNQLAELMKEQQAIDIGSSSVERLSELNDAINALRFELFSSNAVEAFFAKQMAYDNYMLARRKLAEQPLDKAQQAKALAQLNANAPSWLLQQQRESDQLNRYRESAAKGEVDFDETVQAFGIEAADRLVQLEQKRRQWRQSFSLYQQEVERLLLSEQLDGEDLAVEVAALRKRYFAERDWLRVAAMDEQKFGSRLRF